MIKIGITHSEISFQHYPEWILRDHPDVEVIILSTENDGLRQLDACDGLLLSGGVDIHPALYGVSRTDYPFAPSFNESRDAFELEVFQTSFHRGLPILGICRGMQLINVAFGGQLTLDLEETGKENHRRTPSADGLHSVNIDPQSYFYQMTGLDSGFINSAHHQGIHVLGEGLKIVAWAHDGVPEAVELTNKTDSPFFMAVQWHPERFIHERYSNPFSIQIRNKFLNACRKEKQ